MLQTTYTNARANFAGLCNEVADNREIVIIRRRKGGDVAIIEFSPYIIKTPAPA